MNLFTKASLVLHVLRWRRTWNKRDTHYRFTVPGNPKFMGSRDAVQLIHDGDVIATSGIAGNQPICLLYWAIREVFEETGHPAKLTLLCTGGQGGRGKVPGSMEELGKEGLCTRLITGHQETFKSMLALAADGKLEIQCLPQGEVAFLMEAQGRGEESILTSNGVGTFMDPRVGPGSHIFDPKAEQLITVEGDKLRYRAPKISVAMFSAPAADREGNLYLDNASVIAETYDIIRAARKNGGRVIVHVGCIVEKGAGKVVIPAEDLDAIVYDPNGQQVLSIKHSKYWPLFTTHSDMSLEEGISRLRFANRLLGITPRRTPVDDALARLAALTFAENARKGMLVNVGVGLPEEASRILFEAGLLQEVTVFTESGVFGGLPAPGIFFGGAACPKKMVRSAEAFHTCADKLRCNPARRARSRQRRQCRCVQTGQECEKLRRPGWFHRHHRGRPHDHLRDELDGSRQYPDRGRPDQDRQTRRAQVRGERSRRLRSAASRRLRPVRRFSMSRRWACLQLTARGVSWSASCPASIFRKTSSRPRP